MGAGHDLADMLGAVIRRSGAVRVCGTCMDACRLTEGALVAGAHRGSLDELTDWTVWAGKVLVF